MATTQKHAIFSLTTMHEAGLGLLRDFGDLRMSTGWDPETIYREIPGAEALVIRTQGVIDAAVMDAAGPSLKVIGRHGVGFDHVDIDAATERYTLVLKLTLFNSNATTSAGYETVYAPATWVGSSTGGSITFSLLGDSEFGTVTYTAAGRQAHQLNLSNQTYGYTVANLFQ